ncbi:hypothetical protein JCM10908_006930 [Rhodotorula pacifica]|uniref:uncharacterized protein n=1 Tax=Rhodotorula pacifica TaxID=1495444 RepID=UPI003175EC74
MRTTSALAAVVAAASSVHAFAGTYPIVAWSRTSLPTLPELDAVSPGARVAPKGQQQRLNAAESANDLCSLDALFIVSAPGLHASDLALLPSVADSPNGIKASLRDAGEHGGSVQSVPYVSDRLAVAPVGKIVRRFVRCPGADKDVQFVRFGGLLGEGEEQVEAASEDEWRRIVLQKLDSDVARFIADAPAQSAFVLTDLPTSLHVAPSNKHTKRQQLMPSDTSDETLEEILEEIAEEEHVDSKAFDEMISEIDGSSVPIAVPSRDDDAPISITSEEYAAAVDPYTSGASESQDWDGSILDVSSEFQKGENNDTDANNGTSIFQPKEGSGILHRYALFSPGLIVAVLVTFVVLIPTVLVGSQALLSIETVNGLETKMTGSVGIDPSKQ